MDNRMFNVDTINYLMQNLYMVVYSYTYIIKFNIRYVGDKTQKFLHEIEKG